MSVCHCGTVRNVLIGGLITLIGTILVQILIIPSVQRRTRKRERWERDITELQNLMEVDFPKHFRTLRRAIVPFLALHAFPEGHRAEALEQLAYKTAVADAVAAHDELRDTAMRALWLTRRAAVYKPGQNPYWSRLLTDIAKLNASVGVLEPGKFTENADTAATEFEHLLDEAHREQGLIYGTLAYAADPLEPPRTRPFVRQRRWLNEHRRRIVGRLSRRKLVPPDQPSNG